MSKAQHQSVLGLSVTRTLSCWDWKWEQRKRFQFVGWPPRQLRWSFHKWMKSSLVLLGETPHALHFTFYLHLMQSTQKSEALENSNGVRTQPTTPLFLDRISDPARSGSSQLAHHDGRMEYSVRIRQDFIWISPPSNYSPSHVFLNRILQLVIGTFIDWSVNSPKMLFQSDLKQ